MKQIESITLEELKDISASMYEPLVKAVVDVKRELIVLDMPMHVDGELFFLENGSEQFDLWGINLYPSSYGDDDFVEFDSMINIRPSQGNRSRSVDDIKLQERILKIVAGVVNE